MNNSCDHDFHTREILGVETLICTDCKYVMCSDDDEYDRLKADRLIDQIQQAKLQIQARYNVKPSLLCMNRNTFRFLGGMFSIPKELDNNCINRFYGIDVYFDDDMDEGDIDTLAKPPIQYI